MVQDHRHCAARESFKHHAPTSLSNCWKYDHVGGSQSLENLRMAEPAAERNALFDLKRSHKFFKALPFRAIADDSKVCQIFSQKRGSRAQTDVTSFPRN